MPYRVSSGACFISVKVSPKARSSGITGLAASTDGAMSLQVKVRAAPDKGEANREVIALFAEVLGAPRSAFEIVSGGAARQKVIHAAVEPSRIEALIADLRRKEGHGETD